MFGQLAVELGGETMQKYADAAGLTKSIKVDGIQSSVGKFDFSGNDNQLAWSGVGQGQDTLCPINMLQYMGAIANGGKAAVPPRMFLQKFAQFLRIRLMKFARHRIAPFPVIYTL